MLIITLVVHVSNNSQKWRGLFHSPFVLQTFAAHLSAINSSAWVPGLHDKPTHHAVGVLGLAATSVSMTLYCACRVFLIDDRWSGC